MASRIGPGPVFVYESLIFARRRQVYAGRVLFVFAVLIGLGPRGGATLSSVAVVRWHDGRARGDVADAGASPARSSSTAMAGIQLAMVLLVAPAATAGAICHDRARGILAQLADDRPLRRRDRPGQARLAAGADPGPARPAACR